MHIPYFVSSFLFDLPEAWSMVAGRFPSRRPPATTAPSIMAVLYTSYPQSIVIHSEKFRFFFNFNLRQKSICDLSHLEGCNATKRAGNCDQTGGQLKYDQVGGQMAANLIFQW